MAFSPETIDFLWALRLNNSREWFREHKSDYETHLLTPIRALGDAVYDGMQAQFPGWGLNLHLSRIYRDARRLFGRGPMKDHLWFTLAQPSEDDAPRPGFYFSIHPEHYDYGMGFFEAKAATMQAFRADIDRNPQRALALAERLAAQEEFALSGPLYARSKGGPGGLLDGWYNRRILWLERSAPPDEALFSPALADHLLAGFTFLAPYYEWLQTLAVRGEG